MGERHMNPWFRRFLGSLAVVAVFSVSADANVSPGRYTTDGETVTDTKTKLAWQRRATLTTYDWTEAKSYCQNLSLAGRGWRLPTVKELLTIIDYSRATAPFADPDAFPAAPSEVWSSSPVAGAPFVAWIVLDLGVTIQGPTTDASFVRCVR
jgi:uncharacterized protein DUF1566